MSSEHTIHLWDKPIEGRVESLEGLLCAVIHLRLDDAEGCIENSERVLLFIREGRLLEVALLFHKIAQDLAALLPQSHVTDDQAQALADMRDADAQRESVERGRA